MDRTGTAMDMRAATHEIRTLLSRLCGANWSIAPDVVKPRRLAAAPPIATESDSAAVLPRTRRDLAGQRAILLPFPLRGEALLVQLAGQLRARMADHRLDRDPLILLVTRCPGSRLSIDRAAYVEFLDDRGTYCVAIEAEPDTKVTLETTDFDTVVRFVVQYVAERMSEPAALEVAS
jgi:hypothetical protein